MTVKDAMDEIKAARGCAKRLNAIAAKQSDEDTKDCLEESSDMLDRYVSILEQMKVQRA